MATSPTHLHPSPTVGLSLLEGGRIRVGGSVVGILKHNTPVPWVPVCCDAAPTQRWCSEVMCQVDGGIPSSHRYKSRSLLSLVFSPVHCSVCRNHPSHESRSSPEGPPGKPGQWEVEVSSQQGDWALDGAVTCGNAASPGDRRPADCMACRMLAEPKVN